MIVGHQKQWQFLKKSAKTRRLSHAYLFSGQSQLGKKVIALEFVKLLLCQVKKDTEPCQICRSCKDLQKGIHPDFFLIKPQKPNLDKDSVGKSEIKISQIRDLNRKLSLHSTFAPFKTALINDAHCLNSEAQNCLLKTLEEPKGKAILILVTAYPQLLFPTILSRVQNIRFSPVSKSEIESYLKENGCSLPKAQKIALISFGKPGLAINFLKSPQAIQDQDQKIKEVIKLSKAELSFRFQYAKILVSQKQSLKEVLDIWLRYFRSILLEDVKKPLDSSQYSLNRLRKTIQIIEKVIFLVDRTNINQRLALEQIMLEL